MDLKLNQSEITAAIKEYLFTRKYILRDKDIDITFSKGRGETGGITAELVIDTGSPTLQKDTCVESEKEIISSEAEETVRETETDSIFGNTESSE